LERPEAKQQASELQKGWRHKDAVGLLREMILSGELPPGSRLRELAVSERLGMSRTPVREAFRTLAAEGLVNLLPNRSVVVSELDTTESVDVFSVLGALESLAARQACERMTEEEIETLRSLQAELERHFVDMDRRAYTETNRAIHRLVVRGSRNSSLMLAWQMILPRAERARTLISVDRARWAAALEEHRKIYAALVKRDAQLLSTLMEDHFARGVIERMAANKEKIRVKARSSGSPANPKPQAG
jgi:DNA-binding GntR family transcriptional regulator